MKDLKENNVVRFKTISKKPEALYAVFKVKGISSGVAFTATITVDLDAAETHSGDSLEQIIHQCARIGLREFQNASFQFEGFAPISS